MRSELDHLPPQKQLERVVGLIFEEFDDAFALAKHDLEEGRAHPQSDPIWQLCGGTWVDEPHTAKGYQSDYDVLIIVNDKRLPARLVLNFCV